MPLTITTQGLFAALPILHDQIRCSSGTQENHLMPDQSMRSDLVCASFFSFATALPELCWSCIYFMFRDRQEKRIPGGVTIVAAGH